MKKKYIVWYIILVVLAFIVLLAEGIFSAKKPPDSAGPLFPGFDKQAATKLVVQSPTETIAVEKRDGQWLLPDQGDYPVDQDQLDQVWETISTMKKGKITSKKGKDLESYELHKDKAVHVTVFKDKTPLARLAIGKSGPDYLSTFIQAGDEKMVRLIPGSIKYVFSKQAESWKDKQVIDVAPKDVMGLEISTPDYTMAFNMNEQGQFTSPGIGQEKQVNQKTVQDILTAIHPLKANEFPEEGQETNLDAPSYTLLIKTNQGVSKQVFIVGHNEETTQYFITNQDKQYIKVIFSSRLERLFPPQDKLIEDKPQPEPEPEAVENPQENTDKQTPEQPAQTK